MAIAKSILKLTSSILLISPRIHAILLELGCYIKLYSLLSAVRAEFKTEDIFEISNTLFNLATKGYYHYMVEKPVFTDPLKKLEDQVEGINYDDHICVWKYIPIKEHFFVSMLLKCLFEWNVPSNIKEFYLQILSSMLRSSLSNAGVCSQVNNIASTKKI